METKKTKKVRKVKKKQKSLIKSNMTAEEKAEFRKSNLQFEFSKKRNFILHDLPNFTIIL